MFLASTSLPHLLSPNAYFDPGIYSQETMVLRQSWHVVATSHELRRDGDFVATEVAGLPLQVRNFSGELHALSNVCAHRHCMLTSLPCGNSPRMRCQYHGWEYQADGRTGRIPEPKNFVPFDRDQFRLPTYQVGLVGQLVMVNVSPAPVPLREFFGSEFYEFLSERFGSGWRLSLKWSPEYPANWKVPIENSLEAYHVPNVHPGTFKVDPGEEKSDHLLLENRTAFRTQLPFSPHSRIDKWFQSMEGNVVKWLGYRDTRRYGQHHVFPNLLFSFTDAISLCQCIMPTGPTHCRSFVRQFGRRASAKAQALAPLAWLWSRLTASINKHILKEDLRIFSSIQSGLEQSPHRGILGRCEERLHAFQAFMQRRVNSESHQP